ncbi:sterol desaturase family protein [Maliponia aquimaris]|uniref:Fatty acid hydroxylase superfamily protein n=1 Tax=Maliponia aquimaris TaxID=1673631 RepID=A0A238K9F3_9RHOB|nr:sterol desaturase family protein [Maliponia aquimaris]SMX39518.1 Fatty acid hydroxylase superfamily protein [Maliponia aquimaris]
MARTEWNHVPETLPLATNPLWSWPPRPGAVLRWYWDSWFPVSVSLGIVALSFACLAVASPTLEQAVRPGPWIGVILLRNALLAGLLAQGLHMVFHGRALQGTAHKYDPRPFPRQGRMFSFGDQYRDNVFWTMVSGVPIWTLWEAAIWWAMANAVAPVWTWDDGAVWFVAVFFLIPVWESFYFYWIHRLLHAGPFYRFHALHHRNTDVGPWSGLSMHPFEHVLYFGTAAIHLVVPTHPVHLVCHLMFYALYAITTHTGFEGLWAAGRKRLHLGNFHHQMHHRYFEVNYGTLEVPWDRLFGTFHDGTEEAKARMKERLKARARS